MTNRTENAWRIGVAALVAAIILTGLTGCSVMTMIHGGATPPHASEFGLGPRTSAAGLYIATLEPLEPLRPRKLQAIRVALTGARGEAIDGATIGIDGGMPQHGHGLPTQPRVTSAEGGGVYVIEGVRFNMGGWWELQLSIDGEAGIDTVTFNLQL